MGKIGLIIKREYLTRVRNRTFIIMTILGPLLFIGFYAVLIFAIVSQEEKAHTVCVVNDSPFKKEMNKTFLKYNVMHPKGNLKFVFTHNDRFQAIDHLKDEQYQSVLYIPPNCPPHYKGIILGYQTRPSNSMKLAIDQEVSKMATQLNMLNAGLDSTYKDSIHKSVTVRMEQAEFMGSEEGRDKENLRQIRTIVGYIFGIGVYLFIFMYGVQVFRGVMEEKTNRIVEVVISSVKPFQLMLGKIIGIALVGLTQFIILVTFTTLVISGLTIAFAPEIQQQVQAGTMETQMDVNGFNAGFFIDALYMMKLHILIPIFLFYFIFGYLLYASLFAAVGSSVDSESDSQQFMLPITLPLVFAFAMGQYVINDPDGPLAVTLSMIPFTSPIIMTVRACVSESLPLWQLLLSMTIQVVTFYIVVRMAAKIYRTGILMYGKKPTYKELFKWLRYRN
jgi:ABC-2 type transport system permease protein